jgi:hypothetical protein
LGVELFSAEGQTGITKFLLAFRYFQKGLSNNNNNNNNNNVALVFQVAVLCVVTLGVVLSAPQQSTSPIPILRSAQETDFAGRYSFRWLWLSFLLVDFPLSTVCSLCVCVQHSQTKAVTLWRSWLRHCATIRNFAGSIPDGVAGVSHWHNPSDHTMSLGSTQPVTEMSTTNISWGVKAAGE